MKQVLIVYFAMIIKTNQKYRSDCVDACYKVRYYFVTGPNVSNNIPLRNNMATEISFNLFTINIVQNTTIHKLIYNDMRTYKYGDHSSVSTREKKGKELERSSQRACV